MEYIFASDPHGTGEPWIELVKQAQVNYPDAKLVFGGDYIDGRKHSKETLDFVIEQAANPNVEVLLGNHEDMMLNFVEKGDDLWFLNGAKKTIKSLLGRGYSQNKAKALLKATPYYQFIVSIRDNLSYEDNNFLFMHAGFDIKHPEKRDRELLLWARDEYFYEDMIRRTFAHNPLNKTIVTGHTPTCIIDGRFLAGRAEGLPEEYKEDLINYACPVLRVQYKGEKARYLTDNGCHGDLPSHNGNVAVFNENGTLLKVYS